MDVYYEEKQLEKAIEGLLVSKQVRGDLKEAIVALVRAAVSEVRDEISEIRSGQK